MQADALNYAALQTYQRGDTATANALAGRASQMMAAGYASDIFEHKGDAQKGGSVLSMLIPVGVTAKAASAAAKVVRGVKELEITAEAAKLGGAGADAAKLGETVKAGDVGSDVARVGDGVAIKKKPVPPKTLSNAEHKAWLEQNGYRDVEGHLKGVDQSKPVELIQLEKGDKFDMWVRDGGSPGSYSTPPGTNPSTLGIETAGRHLETFTVNTPFSVVRSTVADFSSGQVPGVGGLGGGIQYQMPRGYQSNLLGK